MRAKQRLYIGRNDLLSMGEDDPQLETWFKEKRDIDEILTELADDTGLDDRARDPWTD